MLELIEQILKNKSYDAAHKLALIEAVISLEKKSGFESFDEFKSFFSAHPSPVDSNVLNFSWSRRWVTASEVNIPNVTNPCWLHLGDDFLFVSPRDDSPPGDLHFDVYCWISKDPRDDLRKIADLRCHQITN